MIEIYQDRGSSSTNKLENKKSLKTYDRNLPRQRQ